MKEYLIYVSKYLGIALIAGSVVHAGTLSEDMNRYIIIGIVGLVLFLVGEVLEELSGGNGLKIRLLVLATLLSLATGFMSGGVQHYLENPGYAGGILGIGLIVGYVSFMLKSGKKLGVLSTVLTLAFSVAIFFGSINAVKYLDIGGSSHSHSESASEPHHSAMTDEDQDQDKMTHEMSDDKTPDAHNAEKGHANDHVDKKPHK
ncbi:MAG: hypothetical protein QM537_01925 [Candidatus Symbiobacter sp.]|nr:hypothetical protein [Candidatus Symbiobacter sp.]